MSTARIPGSGEVPGGLGRIVRIPGTPVSFRTHTRVLLVGAALLLVGFALLVLAVGTGEYPISVGDVLATLLGGGDQGQSFIVETIRLPRALTALLVGAALGAAGAIFQSVTRNPLGSPDIIGFTSGASAGAVLQIVAFDGGAGAVALGALAGGLGTALLVGLLAFKGGEGVQGCRLILIGIGISFVMVGITNYLLTRARLEDAAAANVWITGSLNGRGWEQVVPVAIALAVVLPLTFVLARELRMMEMGDDAAGALGVSVGRARTGLLLLAVVLTAVATSSTGPVLFVALAAPQISRRLTRVTGPGVGVAALTGAVLLIGSDFLAQRVFPDQQLAVGVVTGVLGGVYLIWLLWNEWRGDRA
ncbi:iron chelate uptake ABC transporter family permease subunit [Patulibacter sp.]|uniref:FecCD family ABC transporter permease n=1 Tax=Patulibacter sp. TaxID=1912859 RepID=UPI0027269D2D|nr:iron chelate uptake ABC transporter family permease subunit [Patulibacter sp.]MDO9410368.1 iron chelate uptake ABC transporter family permease subunit [Patulibacter sp.]